jgi:hypothetical protein
MRKKGAIELSMTTIIVIILGVVLLSLGLVFVKGIFSKITSISDQAFLVADQEIREKMGSDETFYVGGTNIELDAGKSITINTGIRNIAEKAGTSTKFTITGDCDCDEVEIIASETKKTIEEGERGGIPIVVVVNKIAQPGQICTCSIKAMKGSQEYEDEIIVVKVK